MGQVVDDGRSGGRGVEHPCPGQEVLQTHPGDALLRSLGLAPRSFPAGSVGHGVRFVEHDHAIEIFTGPGENMVEARCVVYARQQSRKSKRSEERRVGKRWERTVKVGWLRTI